MKLAIIGSKNSSVENLEDYISDDVTEIISGRKNQIGYQVEDYAKSHDIPLTGIFPDFAKYKLGASLVSDAQIADYADAALIFWDGISRYTWYAVLLFKKREKEVKVVAL